MKKLLTLLFALFTVPTFAQVGQSPAQIVYSASDPSTTVNCTPGTLWWNTSTNEEWICEAALNQNPRYVNLSEAAGSTSVGGTTTQAGFAAPAAPAIQHATVGAEIGTNSSFATDLTGWSGTNWAWAAGGKALHTAGSTAALTQNVTVVNGTWYQIQWTMSGGSAGTLSISVGSQTLRTNVLFAIGGEMFVFQSTQSGSVALSATPTTDFNGNLDSFTLKPYTAEKPIIFSYKSFNGTDFAQVRGAQDFPGPTTNLYIGADAGRFATGDGEQIAIGMVALRYTGGNGDGVGGYRNTAIGAYALRDNTLGLENTAIGRAAMSQNTMGSRNVVVGMNAMNSARGVNDSVAVGYNAFLSTVYASQPAGVGVGNSVLRSQTTGNRNTAVGNGAGFTGSAVTTSTLMTFLGQDASLGSSTQRTNSSAIGANARVDCDNCMLFGDSGVTDAYFGSMTGATTLRFNGARLRSGGKIEWSSTADPSGTLDTGIQRGGAGLVRAIAGAGNGKYTTADGDASSPGFQFTNDGDSGLYLSAANKPAMSAGNSASVFFVSGGIQIPNGSVAFCTGGGCSAQDAHISRVGGANGLTFTTNGSNITAFAKFSLEVTANTGTATPTGIDSNKLFTNVGDGDGSSVTLPNDPVAGTCYWGAVSATQNFDFTPSAGESIRDGASSGTTRIRSSTQGDTIHICAITGGNGAEWRVMSKIGTWTVS